MAPALLLLLLLCAPAAAQRPAPEPDPLAELERFTGRYATGRIEYGADDELALRGLVERLVRLRRSAPAQAPRVDLALLDLASLGAASARDVEPAPIGVADERLRRVASAALDELAAGPDGPAFCRAVLRDVVLLRGDAPLARRRAGLRLVCAYPGDELELALLTLARGRDDPLRGEVLLCLADHPGPLADRFLVERLGRPREPDEPHPFTLLLRRVRGSQPPLDEEAAALLVQRIPPMLIDPDWREASRAIELGRGMAVARAVPLLIEAMSVWQNRAALGRGSRRIENELLRELQRLSGRTIGAHPKRWYTWWTAVQRGDVALAASEEDAGAQQSSATFFGLRPISDRVTFVIDHSGSMAWAWGTGERSRYEEAVEQMLRFLQASGERTRFNVVLFSEEPVLSSRELQSATAAQLESARRSLLRREPGGGTHLRRGVELALALDASGRPDLARLEADTVIVLCDGRTAEGSDWVAPFITRVNEEARIVFHCVLIGSSGDGALEALCAATGGDFICRGG